MWVHYFVGEHIVGKRFFHRNGGIGMELAYSECPMRSENDRLDARSKLISATPYLDGVEHGTAYQWAKDGRFIGTYTKEHGTGIDLWWNELMDDRVALTEAYEIVGGDRHGREWSFYSCLPWKLSYEKLWFERKQHGIERDWNVKGILRRGWPKYWINDQQVDKKKYLRAAAKDPTLPPFRLEDNLPIREFPPLVTQHLK